MVVNEVVWINPMVRMDNVHYIRRTPFIMDNGGIIAGGGGGGGGGRNSNCVYQNTNYFSCMKEPVF